MKRVLLVNPFIRPNESAFSPFSGETGGYSWQVVHDLTAAYHTAEHHRPSAAVVDVHLAQLPEFEVLVLLFEALRMRCVLTSWSGQDERSISDAASRHGVYAAHANEIWARLDEVFGHTVSSAARERQGKAAPVGHAFDDGLILLGASTGGVDALLSVLSSFPKECPPAVVVQHTGQTFTSGLAKLLNARVRPHVKEAGAGDIPKKGHIFLAPGGAAHLRVARHLSGPLRLTPGGTISGHCPSVDELFQSALPNAGRVTAALLTGMGRDGADGLLALRQAGATTIAQDRASSTVFGMPKAAIELGAATSVLPLSEIGPALLRSRKKQAVS